jgi:hypothetical protein
MGVDCLANGLLQFAFCEEQGQSTALSLLFAGSRWRQGENVILPQSD